MEDRSFIFVILFSICSGIAVLGDCPAGWTQHNNKCYYIPSFYTRKNYVQSVEWCRGHNASLLTVSSQDELDFVKTILLTGPRTEYFTNLLYNATAKTWYWSDGTFYNKTLIKWYRNVNAPTAAQIKTHLTCSYVYSFAPYTGMLYLANCMSGYPIFCQRPANTYDLCNEDDGWKDIFGNCYKFFQIKSTWFDAMTTCQQNGGYLPTPQKNTDVMLFGDLVDCRSLDNKLWTAFTDQSTPGTLRSVYTNETMKYSYWYNSVTTAPFGQQCIMMESISNFQFSRDYCVSEHNFVCSKPHGTCPSGWITSANMCYQVHNTATSKTTWFMANDVCKKQGVQLLSVEDAQTETRVQALLGRLHVSDAWLAFNDRQHDGNYTWADGTSLNVSSTYRHWNKGYPRPVPGVTDCGIIAGRSGSYWTNGYCYSSRAFICQMPISQKYVNHTEPANNVTCPKGWKLFRQDCYFMGPSKTWAQARQYCKSNNGDLTTIRDELEQSFITTTVRVSYAWIGLYRDRHTTNKDFIWVDNTPVTFNNFAPGQPRDIRYNQDCIDSRYYRASYPGGWEGNSCNARKNYICRAPAIGGTPIPPTGSTLSWSYRCGPDWLFNGMEGSCYQIVLGATKNWVDARADCLRKRADLISIDGPKEQTFIQAVLSSGQYANVQDWFWTGATDRSREGGWTWSNHAPFRYINWHEGEPNMKDGDEDCVEMIPAWNYQWNDKICSVNRNYICEKQATPESTVSPLVTQTTQAGQSPCRAQSMISGTYSLPSGQGALQAKSSRDPTHGAEASRLISTNKAAWSAATNTLDQWISATFYNIIITKGIKIVGRRDTNEWVTQFKLMYQYDFFSPWYTYQDPPGTDKLFKGNINSVTTVQVLLSFPIEAKSIKLIPTAWHGGISLKWEILGCIEEDCYADYGVSGPLFVQDGGFSASSTNDPQHSSHDSRLRSNGPTYIPSCWKPKASDKNAWLEIDLGSVKVIRGVTTAGNPAAAEWVTRYQLQYRLDDGNTRNFIYQEPYGRNYVFIGNTNNGTFVTRMMKSHFQAQHVRIVVQAFHTAIALRVDLLVCPITCREIPLINGPQKVSDSQLTASSALNSEHGAQRSRLNQPAQGDYIGGWEAEFNDQNQYIQVDLGRVVEVTAVATQGRDDQLQFVRSYTLASSTDGIHWYPYYEGKTVHSFDGNWDSQTVRKHYLMIPMNVRYVRLWPTDWQSRVSMRWEVYGCPGPMSGTAVGCYADSKTDRDLPYEPLTDPAAGVWPPACIHHCYLKGYFYAGLQNGFECFCGNSYGKYGPGANCSMPCFPHREMKCGGPLTNYIHSTGLSFEKVCMQGWASYQDDCFKIMNDVSTWSDARTQCKTIGGDLASINDQKQQDYLYSLMTKGGDDVWIGMNDLQEMMFYEWSNERPVLYTNWDLNEPSNMPGKSEDCVTVNYKTGGWKDENCANQHKYICIAAKTASDIPTQKPVVEGCELGWDGFRWSCYLYIQEARSWNDASQVCISFGGTLVRTDDRFEQAYLGSTLGSLNGQYWSDATDNHGTGTYMYSDGSSVPLTNWAKNKPDQNGTCVALGTGVNTGLWYNVACNITLAAVCERIRVGYTRPATLPPTSPTMPCPSGWIDEGGYCYQVNSNPINQQLSWDDASKDCQNQNAHLASFHNATVFNNFWKSNLVGGTDHFWIGLRTNAAGGKQGYHWTDKSAVDFTLWANGEPNNQHGDELCVEVFVQYGKFNDQSCWRLRNWICGIKKGMSPKPRTTMHVPSAGPPGSCLNLGDQWKMYNNYCYMAQDGTGDMGKTWRQARQWCNSMGADLVSILGINEQLFVQNLVSNLSDVHVWTGFNELDGKLGYQWSDGSATPFMFWNKNEPNDFQGSESCGDMAVYNGRWNDEHCSVVQGYVCKKNLGTNQPPVTQSSVFYGYCPTGFSTFGNRCFKINTSVLDQTQARKVCKGLGRGYDLASILNAREQAFVTTMLLNSPVDLWLGMFKTQIVEKAIDLRWAFNDDPMQYTNWATNEPNGGMKEPCVMMYTRQNHAGEWNDNSCTTPMGSLCETLRKPSIQHPEAIPNPCNSAQGWKPLGQDCFKLITTPKTWQDASTYCQSVGAALTSISTPYQQAFVYLMASDNSSTNPIWIGLNDVTKQGKYTWVDNWPVLYTNWGANEPSRGTNEGCVLFEPIKGLWSDDDCSKPLNFACRITTAQPAFTPATPNGECPGDEWEAFMGSCYRFMSTKLYKFSDAAFQCEEYRGSLVSIHDNTTNQFILSRINIQTPLSVWIGLRRSQNSGFSWRDNTPVAFDNWASGEPSNKDPNGVPETCAEMSAQTGLWNDVSCDTSRGLICERPQVHDTNMQTFPPIPPQGAITTPVSPTLPSQEIPTPVVPSTGRPQTPAPQTPSPRRTTLTPPKKFPTGGPTFNPFHTPPLVTQHTPAPPRTTSHINQHSTPLMVAAPSSSLGGGAIAAIVLGVIIAIVVAIIVTIFIMRKRGSQGYAMYDSGTKGFTNAIYDKENALETSA